MLFKMLCRRLGGLVFRTTALNSSFFGATYARPVLRFRPPSLATVSYNSTSANNAENDGGGTKFNLKRRDGKRLTELTAKANRKPTLMNGLAATLGLQVYMNATVLSLPGAEFFDVVKEVASKEGKEDFAVPIPAFEALLAEYDALLNEGLDWKDKYQRSLAETENVRKRGFKQTEEAKVFAIQGFCKDLLEVADVLDLAVDSVKEEQLKSADKTLSDLHQGIVMTRTVLLNTFKKHGLNPVNPIGEKFDPNLHEAVFQVPPGPDAKAEPGHIMHVSKIGYSLKDRPVRAAQVGVVTES
ncbi:co-chaperone GrpE [Necator americanus]|uniref:Co-chaperone GrpE n=1 Tax=Necator americanus TaxID=51031 RepID=W2TQ05_NECAM|nr:co-chaperone GrpE [Necator americanus]ETN83853.1 co-chaperone GrpE [Necator americanus]